MRSYLFSVCISAQLLFLTALLPGYSQASYVVNFSDTVNYWTGFSNNTAQDATDVVGSTPDITGGSVVIDDFGYLDQISFNHLQTERTSPDAGDLFIDLGSDGYWDYVVDVVTQREWTATTTNSALIYSFGIKEFQITDRSKYVFADSYWDGGYREAHPVGFLATGNGTDTGKTASVTGPFVASTPVVFSFSDQLINIGNSPMTIGLAASCANDALFSEVAPVPEPATMLLFGAGLIGLAGSRLRRKKN